MAVPAAGLPIPPPWPVNGQKHRVMPAVPRVPLASPHRWKVCVRDLRVWSHLCVLQVGR